jgi:hypothetical protein
MLKLNKYFAVLNITLNIAMLFMKSQLDRQLIPFHSQI